MKATKRGKRTDPADASTAELHGDQLRATDLSIRPGGRRLGELLVEANLATRDQVIAALTEAQRGTGPPRPLGQRLVDRGVLDERAVSWTLARQHGLEFVDLRES